MGAAAAWGGGRARSDFQSARLCTPPYRQSGLLLTDLLCFAALTAASAAPSFTALPAALEPSCCTCAAWHKQWTTHRWRCACCAVLQVKALLGDSYHTLNNLLCDDFSLRHPPSVQAAALVHAARKAAGVLPYWPAALRQLTGYDERTHSQVWVGGWVLWCVVCRKRQGGVACVVTVGGGFCWGWEREPARKSAWAGFGLVVGCLADRAGPVVQQRPSWR